MPLHRLESSGPNGDESPSRARLTLVPAPEPPARRVGTLRMLGVVRGHAGEPIHGARLEWWHPADDAQLDTGRTGQPNGSAATCERGGFDLVAGDADEHLRVVVRAEGYAPLDVRLVPLPGLPPISPPISRSGRAPLAVRPGAAGRVECWCEFTLTSQGLRSI
ncbi:hypothetical protein ACFWPA_06210 [Rhodococcus sp. NPDC058505]|uniref:hypothetical protein n=1 Tax=Rhodococcus sp. NPDC058505 TaxID=3346531 RepID=UPI003667B2EF